MGIQEYNSKVDGLFTPGKSFRFKGDYYTMDVDNYITASCAVVDPIFGLVNCSYINNLGVSKVEGVELEGTYDAGYVFAGLSYSHNNTTLPSQMDGLGLHSYLPGDVTTITAGLRFFNERLTVGGRTYITGRVRRVTSTSIQATRCSMTAIRPTTSSPITRSPMTSTSG